MEIDGQNLKDEPQAGAEPIIAPTRRPGLSRRRIITVVVVTLVNVSLLALIWSQLLTPAQNPDPTVTTGTSFFSGPLVGKSAPNFTLGLLAAQPQPNAQLSLASLKGKPIVLNVWQSSCVPCVDEASMFQTTWQRVQTQGVVFLGMDFQDNQNDALSFVNTHHITYQNVVDASGSVAINYGITGTPETIFINRQGMIVGRHAGELTAQNLEQGLALLAH